MSDAAIVEVRRPSLPPRAAVRGSSARADARVARSQAVQAAKKELMLMGVKKAARQEVPTYSFKALKHKIAQLKTVRREREIEKGVGIRESRGLDYVMRRDNIFW